MVKNNQQKAQFIKTETSRKIQEGKMFMSDSKKSLADINRSENKRIKELKTIKLAQEWDSSRVLPCLFRAALLKSISSNKI